MTAGCALVRRIARDFIEKARAADLLKKASGPSSLPPPIPGSVPLRTRDLPVLRPRPAPPYASELSFLLLHALSRYSRASRRYGATEERTRHPNEDFSHDANARSGNGWASGPRFVRARGA